MYAIWGPRHPLGRSARQPCSGFGAAPWAPASARPALRVAGLGGHWIRRLAVVVVLVLAPAALANARDYVVLMLQPGTLGEISFEEYKASTSPVGKTIAAIFGPISELRVEFDGGVNRTETDGDPREVERKVRERIDRAKCLGRDSEVAWHKARWVRGHLVLKNGRILPVQILLSGIVVGDLLFGSEAGPIAPANGASSHR